MKSRCDILSSGHIVTQFSPKWRRSGKTEDTVHPQHKWPTYSSATFVSVSLHSAPYPPAFAIALLNWFAVRCSGLSRRSRAILGRSSPYFFTRHSRYDLSPKDVCRSRTVAEAARFSRSTGSVGEPLKQFFQVKRRRYECAALTSRRHHDPYIEDTS